MKLQQNSISGVAAHTFSKLPYLNSVDLRHNQIRSLSKESLRKAIDGESFLNLERKYIFHVRNFKLKFMPIIINYDQLFLKALYII